MTVRYDLDEEGAAFVTLDSPETRNALSDVVLDELLARLERARLDDVVRVVGAGFLSREGLLGGR